MHFVRKAILLVLFALMAHMPLFAQAPANDLCQNATNLGLLPLGSQTCSAGTNVNANPEFPYAFQNGCFPTGNTASVANDVWYTFTTAAGSNQLNVSLTGTMATLNVSLYSGSCGSLSGLGCEVSTNGSANHTFGQIQASTTYYIQVSGGNIGDVGTFNLCLNSSNNPYACINQGQFVVTPSPANGSFIPGQVVTFCYTISSYNQLNANWLHGITIQPGAGWDPATFTIISSPPSCDGSGNWAYYNSCTSSASGQVFGAGFYYDSSLGGPLDGNPGNNYGDDDTHNCTWTFCWSYQVRNPGAGGCAAVPLAQRDLTMGALPTSDGISGSWTNIQCTGDPVAVSNLVLTCCPQPLISTHNPTCSGICNGSVRATGQGIAPNTYQWSGPNGFTATTDSISGLCAGLYTVIVTDATNCTVATSVLLNNAAGITVNADSVDITCNGANNGKAFVTITGANGPFGYTWNTTPTQTTDTITGLSAGNYTVTVTFSGGCSDSVKTIVNEPTPVTFTKTRTNITCNGAPNGNASIVATGGNGPYTYLWSTTPPKTTSYISNVVAGIYTIAVTDAKGCVKSDTIAITQPPALSVTLKNDSVKCFGAATGSAWVIPNGGQTPYTFNWNTTPAQLTDTAINLVAGAYNVTLTDANGCNYTGGTTVYQPTLLTSIGYSDSVKCGGGNTGRAFVSPSGGVLPYLFQWAGSTVTSDTLDNLPVGTYYGTVVDHNNCQISDTILVGQLPALVDSIFADSVLCNGGKTGLAYTVAYGGKSPYTYFWNSNPPQYSDTATNLAANTYIVTIKDINGCEHKDTIGLGEPPLLAVVLANDSVTCNGMNNGKAWVTATGGVKPYTYAWNSGTPPYTDTLSALSSGAYIVSVTDSKNCLVAGATVVKEPKALSLTLKVDSNHCFGDSTGFIGVLASGGIRPYSYLWSNGTTDHNATNIAAGLYSMTVTDAHQCQDSATSINVYQPLAITLSAVGDTVKCSTGRNGNISLAVNGGSAPFSFSWDNFAPAVQNPFGLAAGTYTVTVTDKNHCIDTISATVFDRRPLIITGHVDNVKCFNQNSGNITIGVTGGLPPYKYNWSNGPTTQNDSAVALGGYQVLVTDSNSCKDSASFNVTQPPLLSTLISIAYPNACPDSLINLPINQLTSGGTLPFTYLWSDASTNQNDVVSAYGNYSVTVTDSKGCQDSTSISVTPPIPLSLVLKIDSATCFGFNNGKVLANATGGYGNFTYRLTGNGKDTTGVLFDSLSAGNYTIQVMDKLGCKKDSVININQQPNITIKTTDVTIDVGKDTTLVPLVTGIRPTDSVSYVWTPSTSLSCVDCDSPITSPLDTILYHVTVDVNGCKYTDSLYVFASLKHIFYAPNVFTPNGDGNNDVYGFEAKGIRKIELKIFNRWGDEVFEGHSIDDKWDGTFNGKPADSGLYVYEVYVEFLDRFNFRKHGGITLIR